MSHPEIQFCWGLQGSASCGKVTCGGCTGLRHDKQDGMSVEKNGDGGQVTEGCYYGSGRAGEVTEHCVLQQTEADRVAFFFS